MKKLPTWIRALLLMMFNALPFVGKVFLYEWGAPMDVILFPPVAAGLILLNHYACKSMTGFALIQGYMGLCAYGASTLSAYLYYHNVSSDWATPVVGELIAFVEVSLIVLATGGIVLGKYLENRKTKSTAEV